MPIPWSQVSTTARIQCLDLIAAERPSIACTKPIAGMLNGSTIALRSKSMRRLAILGCAFLTSTALSHEGRHDDRPINSASELRDGCKSESEASFIGKGIARSNWSASFWEEGNVLVAKGSWRVGTDEVTVECRIARGAQTRFASMPFSGR
jgi:hypothetical protein